MPPRPIIDATKRLAFEKAAQLIADYLRVNDKIATPVKAAFPQRYIRTLKSQKDRWPYLTQDRQRTLACVIQLCDVNRFHLNTWDISLTAGTMCEWHSTMPIAALIETLLYEVGVQEGWFVSRTRFKKVIDTAHSRGVYGDNLRQRLHKLRDYRNEVHLYLKSGPVKMHDGMPKRYNEAVKLFHEVEQTLDTYFSRP